MNLDDSRRQSWRARWRLALLIIALPLVPAVFTGWLHPKRPAWSATIDSTNSIQQLDVETLRANYAHALWLDAREPAAYATAHVPGALLLTEADWETGFAGLIDHWDGSQPLVVYCGGESCRASEAVAKRLRQELAFDEIVVLRGGWDAWLAAEGKQP